MVDLKGLLSFLPSFAGPPKRGTKKKKKIKNFKK
jgi:hypothetical protein